MALAARGHPRERRGPVQLVVGRRLPPHVPAFDCWAAGTPSTVDTCGGLHASRMLYMHKTMHSFARVSDEKRCVVAPLAR